MATLTFLGAARTVTGSKYLLEVDEHRILIDCGQFQGLKELRKRNWAAFPVHPASLSVIVLTHAHIDHSGLLPRMVANGFRGRVICTRGTADLCGVVLPDAGRLQEEDARLANRGRYTKHSPAVPLFTEADAMQSLELLHPVGFDKRVEIAPGIDAEFVQAGHLLGSAFVRVSRQGGKGPRILFGADLGRYGRPVLPDPSPRPDAETLLIESTYGNREHPDLDDAAELRRIVDATLTGGGKVIIPAFAIGRVEEVLYWFKHLEDKRELRPVPIYVDSPMALTTLSLYERHVHELDPDMRVESRDVSVYAATRFRPVSSAKESIRLASSPEPCVVISASGMATGGRVLNHLAAGLPHVRNTVLFVGFQAEGTRGRHLIDGARSVRIHGQEIPVAARIAKLDSMSAHADAGEMLRWLQTSPNAPATTYLVHGEPVAQDALKARIETTLRWRVHVPAHGEKVEVPL
jgi:metallo-beta-lactamase family protein